MSHLLADSSSSLDADRVKWTVPLRLQSNGKSYYDEVSVTMTGVPDERTSGAGGMLCADGKTAVVSEPDNLVVRLNDFVLVRSPEGRQPFVARVVEMWETDSGSKDMRCQWFYRPAECQHETLGADPGLVFMHLHPQEVFLTIHDDPNPITTIVSGCVVVFCNEYKLWREWSKKIPHDRLFFYARQFFPENGTFFNILRGHIQEHLPLAAINPQTFRSDAESEAKAAVKARYPPNPSNITSTQPLPPPRTSIIDQYNESSDHDAALDEQTIAAMCEAAKHVTETGKGRGFLKLRRQQKRLESVKVAKKPKSYAQTAVNDQDEDDVAEDAEPSLEGNGESKDKKSFNFTGDVLYSGDGRQFFKQATLTGLSQTISIGDVCWLMSDIPHRPYIGRIIAMWQDKAGLHPQWFYKKEDTSAAKNKVAPVIGSNPLSEAEIAEKEVFASAAEDDNFLSTVDGVVRLFKGDDVADWNSLRSDPNSLFIRRMYNVIVFASAATAKFLPLDKKWDALPEPRDLVFQ